MACRGMVKVGGCGCGGAVGPPGGQDMHFLYWLGFCENGFTERVWGGGSACRGGGTTGCAGVRKWGKTFGGGAAWVTPPGASVEFLHARK